MMRFVAALTVVWLALAWPQARAADDVVIGAVYPMTGSLATVGADAKAAVETMLDVVNGTHEKIPMLMGAGGGLDRLGGAKLRVVFADSQNDPQKARAEAERLITQDHVVAIIGSYTSATAATISQVTERYEVPYLSMDNSSPTLSKRGLKWFFRTTPNDDMFTAAMFDFFKAMATKTGHPVKTVALFYEDSIFGSDSSNAQRKMAEENGIKVVADIKYRANSPSLSAEAQRLAAAKADVVMPSSYASDAILLLRSLAELHYSPVIMAQSAGFAEQSFISGVGPLADGVFSRSSFAADAVKSRPAIPVINAAFKAKTGKDLNDNTSRELLGTQIIADAINRAGSNKPEDIRKALMATDVPGDQTIMPWRGIKFDETGQNIEATPVIQQISNGAYHTVYPDAVAVQAPVWNVGK